MNTLVVEKMADNHTKFIVGLLKTTQGVSQETCEYLVRAVFLHAWKHAEEELVPKRGYNGRFIKKEY